MHRQILTACLPWLLLLVAALFIARLLVRLSGARYRWGRLSQLHTCQVGSVQSLSFVLTLPIFLVVVLFILQVSQLMVGITVVHYAAFAAARAASVWLPAETALEPANHLTIPMPAGTEEWSVLDINAESSRQSPKLRTIWSAAVLACAPIAPSRQFFSTGPAMEVSAVMERLYSSLVPTSNSNSRIPQRIRNKLSYSLRQTSVSISGLDKNGFVGPASYNPRTSPAWDWTLDPHPYERDWEGPLTVTVRHAFALIPGPGKWLITNVTNSQTTDRTAPRITRVVTDTGEPVLTTSLTAWATLSNEGFKSVMPYAQQIQ